VRWRTPKIGIVLNPFNLPRARSFRIDLGREGSKYGIDEFVEIEYLCFGGITV